MTRPDHSLDLVLCEQGVLEVQKGVVRVASPLLIWPALRFVLGIRMIRAHTADSNAWSAYTAVEGVAEEVESTEVEQA
jgi:hypothetical protein